MWLQHRPLSHWATIHTNTHQRLALVFTGEGYNNHSVHPYVNTFPSIPPIFIEAVLGHHSVWVEFERKTEVRFLKSDNGLYVTVVSLFRSPIHTAHVQLNRDEKDVNVHL